MEFAYGVLKICCHDGRFTGLFFLIFNLPKIEKKRDENLTWSFFTFFTTQIKA
ncbi:hypothetical protein A33Q_3674 [Indibacter alkaliphilus LW1]|uniref:Uncharacterized protein n=1 Tax=Indibacter alkaliphilus (strain CCUG 57479 / KCTC 22604 / LW1) TaxID=1189612 RepID=S2DV47_INDAL|nr:hypothetical protein A33Q_3674 [Indibacter alkaliphilus LW1]